MNASLIAAGYLLGTIPFALLLARRVDGMDIRDVGSGNLGATNVLRAAGTSTGLLVLALDIGKGSAAVWVASRMGADASTRAAVAMAVVTGHVYPVWLRFRGGKGVATACGAFAVLTPAAAGLAVLAFMLVAGATRYVSLGSLSAAVVLVLVVWSSGESIPLRLATLGVAGIVWIRHRANIARLRQGRERRLGAPS